MRALFLIYIKAGSAAGKREPSVFSPSLSLSPGAFLRLVLTGTLRTGEMYKGEQITRAHTQLY